MARIREPRTIYIQQPDSIGPSSDLQPGARVVGAPFQTAPEIPVAGIPRDNSVSQLANALSGIQPTLLKAVSYTEERQFEQAKTNAEADFVKNNQKGFLEAQKEGLIPPGANPYYVEHYKQLELRTKAIQAKGAMYQSYLENGDVRNSDDPAKFIAWSNEWAAGERKGALINEDGSFRYTNREIAGSDYDKTLSSTINEIRNIHVQHRAAVRTKEGEDAFVNYLTVKMQQLGMTPDQDKNLSTFGQSINDEVIRPGTGFAARGLDKSKANTLIVDTVTASAIAQSDPILLQVLDHIKTNDGKSSLAKTKYAIEKSTAASEHITSQIIRNETWDWTRRTRQAGLSPEEQGQRERERAEREKVVWDREDQRFAEEERKAGESQYQFQLHRQVENHMTRILVGLNQAKNPDDPRVKKSMEWLSFNDPEKHMEMARYIDSFARDKAKFIETKASLDMASQLRAAMSQDANSFDSSKIIQAYNRGILSPENLQKLFDDWDKMKNHRDHPFIQDGRFNELANAARRAVMKDADDQYGPAAMRSEAAVMDLRNYAYKWIKDHPQGKQTEFDKAMVDYLDPILQKRAEEFGKEQERAKTKRENPPAIPQPDTRSLFEKVAPEALGGKQKPAPVQPPPQKPAPFEPAVAATINKAIGEAINSGNYTTPEELEMELIGRVWPLYKGNGRDVVSFMEDMKPIAKKYGKKSPSKK